MFSCPIGQVLLLVLPVILSKPKDGWMGVEHPPKYWKCLLNSLVSLQNAFLYQQVGICFIHVFGVAIFDILLVSTKLDWRTRLHML